MTLNSCTSKPWMGAASRANFPPIFAVNFLSLPSPSSSADTKCWRRRDLLAPTFWGRIGFMCSKSNHIQSQWRILNATKDAIQLCFGFASWNSNPWRLWKKPMNCPMCQRVQRACGEIHEFGNTEIQFAWFGSNQFRACQGHPFMRTCTLEPPILILQDDIPWHSLWKVEGAVDFRVFFFFSGVTTVYKCVIFIDIEKWSFFPELSDVLWRWMAMDSQSLAACQSEIEPFLAGGSTQCPVKRKLVLGVLWWGDVA